MSKQPSITERSTLRRVSIVVFFYLTIAATVASTSGWKAHHEMEADGGNYSKAQTGKRIWQRENCVVCHAIYGLGGHMGPDLTNLFSRKGPEYARVMITHGNGKMPAFYLDDAELDALNAYFKYLDALGTYPLESAIKQPFGASK